MASLEEKSVAAIAQSGVVRLTIGWSVCSGLCAMCWWLLLLFAAFSRAGASPGEDSEVSFAVWRVLMSREVAEPMSE
eukprot:7389013-Prymnesium_polylepis.6